MSYVVTGLIFVLMFWLGARKDKVTGQSVAGKVVRKITGKPF